MAVTEASITGRFRKKRRRTYKDQSSSSLLSKLLKGPSSFMLAAYIVFELRSVYFTLLHLFQVDSAGVQVDDVDSRWTPPGMYLIDHISPGLHLEFTGIPHGLHLEFRWSAPKFYLESNLEY